jgi:hypothetical protein
VRSLLGRTSGLCDGAFGAHVQGLYPIALCGNEDQRAIHLPGMASGQTIVAVALLDGDPPCVVSPGADGGYILNGSKQLVALAPIASQLVVLARHKPTSPTEVPRYSMFVVDAGQCRISPEAFVSPLPVGTVAFDHLELDADSRLGGEGQGLMIAQTSLDMMRLPAAAGCLGIARHALIDGVAHVTLGAAPDARILPPSELPRVQRWLLGMGQGNEKAYAGRDGWLFYRADVEYVTGRGFLEEEVLRRRGKDVQADPVRAIVDFRDQLAARGIGLLVVPAPVKPTIHPEMFAGGAERVEGGMQNASFREFVRRLGAAGVAVYDPVAELMKEGGGEAYLKTDTHWLPGAMERVAAGMAEAARAVSMASSRVPSSSYFHPAIQAEGNQSRRRGRTLAAGSRTRWICGRLPGILRVPASEPSGPRTAVTA